MQRAKGKGLEALTLLFRFGAATVSKAIRVKYENGVLKPLEPVDLREGEELIVVVRDKSFYKLALSESFEAERSVDEVLEEVRKRDKKLYE
jgi:predicted DNA-binding antitoxin AbrB/MazE fold protein